MVPIFEISANVFGYKGNAIRYKIIRSVRVPYIRGLLMCRHARNSLGAKNQPIQFRYFSNHALIGLSRDTLGIILFDAYRRTSCLFDRQLSGGSGVPPPSERVLLKRGGTWRLRVWGQGRRGFATQHSWAD